MKKKTCIWMGLLVFPLVVGLACTCGLLPTNSTVNVDPTEESAAVPTEVVIAVEATESIDVDQFLPEATEAIEETNETEEPEETEEVVILPGEELIMFDNMWLQEENEVFVAFFLKNQLSDQALKDIEYKIILLDVDGEEIRTAWNRIHWLSPRQTDAIAYRTVLSSDHSPVDAVTVEYSFKDVVEPEAPLGSLSADMVRLWEGFNNPIATGIIQNTSTTTFTSFRSDIICYDADGAIVGGGTSNHRFIPGQGRVGFNDLVYVYGEVDSVEVFPKLVSGSVIIEDSPTFWDQISVLDEHFFVTRTGGINGGLVLQNNLEDTVLKNTVVLVTYYDEEGYVTTIGYRDINYFLPGGNLGIMPSFLTQSKDAIPTHYEFSVLPGVPVENYELQEDPFTVNEALFKEDDNNYVTVKYTSTYTKPVSELAVFILLYNPEGEIIGGAVSNTEDPIPAGGSGEVDIYVFYSRDLTVSEIKAWLAPSIWTKFE